MRAVTSLEQDERAVSIEVQDGWKEIRIGVGEERPDCVGYDPTKPLKPYDEKKGCAVILTMQGKNVYAEIWGKGGAKMIKRIKLPVKSCKVE